MAAETRAEGSSFIAGVPIHVYKHGRSWGGYTHDENGPQKWVGTMDVHSTRAEINHVDITDFDLTALVSFRDDLVKQFTTSMERELVGTLHSALADREAVNLNLSGDPREGLKRMWTDIKIGLDKNLQLNTPRLLMDPVSKKKLEESLERLAAEHPEFPEEMAEIRRKKHVEALIEYYENLRKFKLDDSLRSIVDHNLLSLREAE
ncbi:MAG: hypothetical protein EOP84_04490 [Verrucomicrobiaceae bacterium]|nr:MAG: hypothetical protein EOP84_04490 [Verrucomicrobiaceae bacterium]